MAVWLQAGQEDAFSEGNGAAAAQAERPAAVRGTAAKNGSSTGSKGADMDSVYELLKNLSELSDALVIDAQEDDELYRKGA